MLMLIQDMVDSLRLFYFENMPRVQVVVGKQEDFDISLECYSTAGNIKFSPGLVIKWSSPLSTIKDELFYALLCLACKLTLDLSKTLKHYPQTQFLYQKQKLRYEMTGQFEPISFSDADDEDMSCNAEGPWPFY